MFFYRINQFFYWLHPYEILNRWVTKLICRTGFYNYNLNLFSMYYIIIFCYIKIKFTLSIIKIKFIRSLFSFSWGNSHIVRLFLCFTGFFFLNDIIIIKKIKFSTNLTLVNTWIDLSIQSYNYFRYLLYDFFFTLFLFWLLILLFFHPFLFCSYISISITIWKYN